MVPFKYKDLNLNNLKSNLFCMLKNYDSNFLDKPVNFIYGDKLIEHFNNRNVTKDNINEIIEFCHFLAIDVPSVQNFIIKYSIPSDEPFKLNLEFQTNYYLPNFIKQNCKKNTNIIEESSKLGLLKWIKYALDNNFEWSNKSFYYAIKYGNDDCYQLLSKYDKYNYFKNILPQIIKLDLKYRNNSFNLKTNKKHNIADIFILEKYNSFNYFSSCPSSCPSSSPSSSVSFSNYNLFSEMDFHNYLENNILFYQVISKENNLSKACKIIFENGYLNIPVVINCALYNFNWSKLFIEIFNNYKININFSLKIKVCVHYNSLDYSSAFYDSETHLIKIPIIKENFKSFNSLNLLINNSKILNDQHSINNFLENIKDFSHFTKLKGIVGIVQEDEIFIDPIINNIESFRNNFIDLEDIDNSIIIKINEN